MSVEDEHRIHKLVARYADGVNRRDQECWASTWAEDGVWELPGRPECQGKEAIVALWAGAMGQLLFVAQLVQHGVVDIDGDSAVGTWYLNEHMKFNEAAGAFNIGCYQDRYTKSSGEWLFAERRYTVIFNDGGSGTMSGTTAAVPVR